MATNGKRASTETTETATKKSKPTAEYKLNVNLGVDKEYEQSSFKTIAELPPGALQGLKAGRADDMLAAFNIKTISDLGSWKFYKAAKAIKVLAQLEEDGKRGATSSMNINLALDQEFETSSFKEMLDLPPSALQGLSEWSDGALKELGIKTIASLAEWKYCVWAEAISTAAELETEDFRSR